MDNGTTGATATDDASKWWAHSKTMWGTMITAAATVIPVLGPALGITLPADVITTFGDQALTAVQALTGLFGTVLAIYGRLNAASRANSAQGLTRMVDLAPGGGRSPYSFLVQHGIVSFAKPLKESGWPDWV